MQAFERARELDEVPLMDWRAQWSIRNTLGEAGWELTWTRLRERVAKSGDPRLALAFLDAAVQVGPGEIANETHDHPILECDV